MHCHAGSRQPRRSGNPFMDDDDNNEEDAPSMPTGPNPTGSTTSQHLQGDHQSNQRDQTVHPSASTAPDVYAHTAVASPAGLGADPHGRQLPSDEAPGASQQGFSQLPALVESNTQLSMAGNKGHQHQQHFHTSAQQQPEQPPSATQSAETEPVQSSGLSPMAAPSVEVEISDVPLAEPGHAADNPSSIGSEVSDSHPGEVSRHSGSVTEPAPNSQLLPSQQAGQSQRHTAAPAAQKQQRESQDAAQDQMASVQGSEAEPGGDAGVSPPARQLQAPQLTAQSEQQHPGTVAGKEGALPLPAQRAPVAPPPAEGLVPSRPPPAPPLASEGSGRVFVPWRPAPSAPDQEPAQSLGQQGSMPAPAQTAPSLLPQGQGSLPVSVQGQDALNRPTPVVGPLLEGRGRLGELTQPTSRALPQGLPSRQGSAASQAAGLSAQQGLEGMLGSAAHGVEEEEEEESEASAQDRQKFMQSLQSPDRGSTRTKNLAKGFGRMRAKAKDLMQARNAGAASSGPAGQPAPAQGASHTPTDAELGRGGRLARDMTMMLAGLKKPANQ